MESVESKWSSRSKIEIAANVVLFILIETLGWIALKAPEKSLIKLEVYLNVG